LEDVERFARGLTVPALRLSRVDRPTRSYFGQCGDVAAGFEWPQRRRWFFGRPRTFDVLARLSLNELHAALSIDGLPRDGALLFLVDLPRWPAICPTRLDVFRVVHVDDLAEPVEAAKWRTPSHPPLATNIAFAPKESLPSRDRLTRRVEFTDDEWHRYHDIQYREEASIFGHQCGGYPVIIQSDEEEFGCQIAHDGIDGRDFMARGGDRDAVLEAARRDWRLLLQVDSDDDLELMWGDGGTLYFFVREEDARRGDFSRVRAAWQCY